MTLRIHRQFIATIAAVSMAITGFSAVPARAGDDDLAKALAVILGVAIVGSAIKNNKDDRKSRHEVHRPKPRADHVRRDHVKPRHKRYEPRPLPRHVSRKLLPQRCLFNVRNKNGRSIQAFGERCLERHYKYSNSLPRECGRRVWTKRGQAYGYAARCMSRRGYELARR